MAFDIISVELLRGLCTVGSWKIDKPTELNVDKQDVLLAFGCIRNRTKQSSPWKWRKFLRSGRLSGHNLGWSHWVRQKWSYTESLRLSVWHSSVDSSICEDRSFPEFHGKYCGHTKGSEDWERASGSGHWSAGQPRAGSRAGSSRVKE